MLFPAGQNSLKGISMALNMESWTVYTMAMQAEMKTPNLISMAVVVGILNVTFAN